MDITVPIGKRVCVLVGHRAEVDSAKQGLHLREVSLFLYFLYHTMNEPRPVTHPNLLAIAYVKQIQIQLQFIFGAIRGLT